MSANGQLTADTAGRYRLADEPGTTAPESVPGVPGVPGLLFDLRKRAGGRGHPAGTGVPGVPQPAGADESSKETR